MFAQITVGLLAVLEGRHGKLLIPEIHEVIHSKALAQACDADTAASNLKGLALAPGALRTIERAALQQLVSSHQGSRADLANKLGISERSLYRKLKALK